MPPKLGRPATTTVVYKRKRYKLVDLAREHGLNPDTLRRRIVRGWDVESALQPVLKKT